MATKKSRVSPKNRRAKGNQAEALFAKIMTSLGMPSLRVIGSGKFSQAGGDVKVGVDVIDGKLPGPDETRSVHVVEVKHHASLPDRLWQDCHEPLPVVMGSKDGVEALWDHLEQNSRNNAVALRRSKVPSGAITGERWDEVMVVVLPITEYARLLSKAYPEKVFYVSEESQED